MKLFLIGSIRLYQKLIHPLIDTIFPSGACRYYPTCSNYTLQAIEKHGSVRGTLLSIKRLSRCQPFVQGGIDPVS